MTRKVWPGRVSARRAGVLKSAVRDFDTPNTSDLQARRIRWLGRRAGIAGHHADTVAALFFGEVHK